MKKYILLLVLIFFSLHTEAQKKSKRDHIKSLKIAYITEHLDLTSEEAQKFWPIYNNYHERMYEVKYSQYKKIKHQLKDEGFENLTETEAKELLKKLQQIEKDEYELNQQFISNLDNVISAKKIIYLKKLEDDFNRELLDRLRREHHNKKE